jgi:hypothetical protein
MATRILRLEARPDRGELLIVGVIDGITRPIYDTGKANEPLRHADGRPFTHPLADHDDPDSPRPVLRTNDQPYLLPAEEWPLRELTATADLAAVEHHYGPECYVDVTAAMLDAGDPTPHPTLSAQQLRDMAAGIGPSDQPGHPVTPGRHLLPSAQPRRMLTDELLDFARRRLEESHQPAASAAAAITLADFGPEGI